LSVQLAHLRAGTKAAPRLRNACGAPIRRSQISNFGGASVATASGASPLEVKSEGDEARENRVVV